MPSPSFPAPPSGGKIQVVDGKIQVPDNPIIPCIEGDGIGVDLWPASQRVWDAAVEKSYEGRKKIAWYEVFAGEKAHDKFGEWLPDDTARGYQAPSMWRSRAR